MKGILQTIFLIMVILAIALVAEQIAPLQQLTLYLNEHPQPFTTITIAMAVAGIALCLAGWVIFAILNGRAMSAKEAQEFARTRGHAQVGVFRGEAAGVTSQREMSFRDIKDALRHGEWRRNARLWPFLLELVGVPLAVCGIFGYFFVTGPPTVMLVIGAALVFAIARLTWAWVKA